MTQGFTDGMRSSKDGTWTTPKDFFEKMDREFYFTLDAAALSNSTLVPDNWYGPDHPDSDRRNALVRSWSSDSFGGSVWLNPPYGRTIGYWMKKANVEARPNLPVVCLVPARTDTKWWHDYCIQHEVRFIKGRLKFGNADGVFSPAPFPSAVVIVR